MERKKKSSLSLSLNDETKHTAKGREDAGNPHLIGLPSAAKLYSSHPVGGDVRNSTLLLATSTTSGLRHTPVVWGGGGGGGG